MRGHAPRKRFGQNFLVSPGVVRRIVDAIHPLPGDPVVEIGPGLGALTEPLLAILPVLHVVEIDRDLIARLRLAHSPDCLVIHEGDALDFDFGTLGDGLRIVGNLPYNISTPLLFHLATFADRVRDMHFMLQKEVVDRMVAAPGGSEYGRLSVMLQYRFVMERLFVVPPGAFDPAPKVDSAIVRLAPKERSRLDAADPAMLARIVTAAFGQRRKMLRNNLRDFATADELERAGIAPTARAEDQPLENFVRLANCLAQKKTAG
ncbi:MAG: 16S rRNA (adenine(1518)-N(6)/adenine(1519)-N(6))-dimethyltransferase RsmA [Rhodocyclaceae bacterium]|nr:16S rRNA (adenine(1518)-N(6)/adenine(1519)-N(6))-dimethyltransferase RsmA [Rhodocyclaceae bacterium]